MATQRRTGPSGTSRLMTTRSPISSGLSAIQRFTGGGGGSPLPHSPYGDPTSGPFSSKNLSAAGDMLVSAGQGVCEQHFNPQICAAAAAVVGFVTGSGGGSEPASGDPAIPGITGGGNSLVAQCPDGQINFPGVGCMDLVPGGATQGGGMVVSTGEAVKGRFGVAVQPNIEAQRKLSCPRGMVLGMDELCYDKRSLPRGQRKWVPGRKPLLTGGDLNAISRASRAAGKMKTQQQRLQKLGLLKRSVRTKKVMVCSKCRNPRDECSCS